MDGIRRDYTDITSAEALMTVFYIKVLSAGVTDSDFHAVVEMKVGQGTAASGGEGEFALQKSYAGKAFGKFVFPVF